MKNFRAIMTTSEIIFDESIVQPGDVWIGIFDDLDAAIDNFSDPTDYPISVRGASIYTSYIN